MSDYNQRHRSPDVHDAKAPEGEEAKHLGSSVEADRTWAQQRIQNHFNANRSWTQIQRKADAAGAARGGAAIPQSGGAPLPADARAKMEPRLGDLSGVKVFTGGESEKAAADLGARAFTVGQDVHFGAGEFAPGSKEGDRLLAHELTHTVQAQRSGIQRKPAESGGAGSPEAAGAGEAEVSQPGDATEHEADAVADEVTDGLHGGDDKTEAREAGGVGKQPAAAVAAKLAPGASGGRKIHLAPRNKGGGKNAQHANEDKRAAALAKYEEAKKKLTALRAKPNKTKEDKEELGKLERQVKHLKQQADFTGENHSQRAKGS